MTGGVRPHLSKVTFHANAKSPSPSPAQVAANLALLKVCPSPASNRTVVPMCSRMPTTRAWHGRDWRQRLRQGVVNHVGISMPNAGDARLVNTNHAVRLGMNNIMAMSTMATGTLCRMRPTVSPRSMRSSKGPCTWPSWWTCGLMTGVHQRRAARAESRPGNLFHEDGVSHSGPCLWANGRARCLGSRTQTTLGQKSSEHTSQPTRSCKRFRHQVQAHGMMKAPPNDKMRPRWSMPLLPISTKRPPRRVRSPKTGGGQKHAVRG